MFVSNTADVPHHYFLSMLSQAFYVIIDRGVISPVNATEAVDGLDATKQCFIFQLTSTAQSPSAKMYDTHMDLFQPKTGCSLSFSGMYQHIFLDRRNRTNSR